MVTLSFEKFLENSMLEGSFGKSRFVASSKERPHISKVRLDSLSGCIYLGVSDLYVYTHDEALGFRYAACANMAYDMMLSVYDVNHGMLILYRFYDFRPDMGAEILKKIRSAKGPNWEARLIGMLTGQGTAKLDSVMHFVQGNGIRLVDVDLYGTDTRNIAIDAKTGMVFDILMENKPYKPGELANKLTQEQFERGIMQIINMKPVIEENAINPARLLPKGWLKPPKAPKQRPPKKNRLEAISKFIRRRRRPQQESGQQAAQTQQPAPAQKGEGTAGGAQQQAAQKPAAEGQPKP